MGMKQKKAIVNAKVVLETGIIWNGVILLDGEKIVKAANADRVEIPEDVEVIDAKGAYVGPGFVDIHAHGGVGARMMENPKVARHFLKHGETTILPTSSNSFSYEQLMDGIRMIKEHKEEEKNIKGIYMEGPYINTNYGAAKGMQTWPTVFDPEKYIPMVDELGDLVKVWTIAPEREGIRDFLAYARKVNPTVVFSVGHSEAIPAEIRALSPEFTPRLMTHIMDATGRGVPDTGGTRGYGPDEYCLSDPEMYAELICDSLGVHVAGDLQRMILRCKGVDRMVLVTDSTSSNGAAPEKYAHVKDINFNQRGGISGSKLTMDQACRNIMSHTTCGIAEAFLMASRNPARVIGMDREIGTIEPGKIADLVFVDDMFNVQKVILAGEVCKFDEE